MTGKPLSSFVVALCAGLVACGGYGSAYQGSVSMAESPCARAFACQGSYPSDAQSAFSDLYGSSEDVCVGRIGPDAAQEDDWDAAADAGTVTYDKDAAKACVTAVEAQACEAFFADGAPESCRVAVEGSLALDEECAIDAECASNLCQSGRCAGVSGGE